MVFTRLLRVLGLASSLAGLQTVSAAEGTETVFSAVGESPDLSTFSSWILCTGGESGKPGREFEERFNTDRPSLKYTVLAPTNDAFSSVPPDVIKALKSIPSYQLLASILRTHIVLGDLTTEDMLTASNNTEVVEGFILDIDKNGSITTNKGLTSPSLPIGHQANIIKDSYQQPTRIPATNGAVYKIDKLLNPFTTYFGIDPQTPQLPPTTNHPGTMADIVSENDNLSNLTSMLGVIDPDFFTRLSLSPPKSSTTDQNIVFLAPSNTAFDVLGPKAMGKAMEPANAVMDGDMLEFGLGEYDAALGMVRSIKGFNITVDGGRAANARVEERVCGQNGCVWIVGRWLDPLFGIF